MKNSVLYFFLFGFVTLLTACHKNNYVTTIPAPRFTYVKTEPKPVETKENEVRKEHLSDTPEISDTDLKVPVLTASSNNSASYENRVELPTTAASKAATAQLVKELSVSNGSAAKKQTLKERMLKKVLIKRIEKMQSGTKPKAGSTNMVSLISGIAGILAIVLLLTSVAGLSLLLAAAAIIMGFVGKAQIRRTGERGVGWAITGIVSGILIFFLLLLAVVFIATLFGL
jgi:Domain of unknown function (DUF4190)